MKMIDDAPQSLLYDPRFEHDACGVGFVADVSGRQSHGVLDTSMRALANLAHRGAVDADGKTGDGAGILTQLPRKLFSREVERLARRRVDPNDLAVAAVFLPRGDRESAAACRKIIDDVLSHHGLRPLCMRRVPVNERALGAKAAATAPLIEQVLISREQTPPDDYERTLYLVRREVEKAAAEIDGFYIASLSSRTIVYKGLFVATELKTFYEDLSDGDFETALAVIHQRYSTNTFPNWFLAQPFRLLAHNGEINTIGANRNWMRAREPEMRSEVWGDRIERLKPVIWPAGSDSASLDNALELLVRSGRDPLQSMMMLLPEAHENAPDMDADLRGFYDFASCLVEPWDGPAAVVFSDGRYVGATLDRNGLRPARYVITREGLIIMASEAGVIELDAEQVAEKGRLGPGRMIAVDAERGLLLKDAEIKLERARRKPYREWMRRMAACPKNTDVGGAVTSDETDLTLRMKCFGYTLEDVKRIMEPMFDDGKEAVGSMGDDTPLAALSGRPRLLYDYFKQRFAQVTNPAIDPLRERLVMSLETLIGPRRSLLDETEQHAKLVRLKSPILTDSEIEWLRREKVHGLKSATLAALYGRRGGERALEHVLDALCEQAVEAVGRGASILILSDRGASRFQSPIPMLLAVGATHNRLMREGLRMRASIVAETGEAREDHHFACLIGYGASAVNPYLAFEIVASVVGRREMSTAGAVRNYKTAVENGLLKIMSKMGIATVASYCGAQLFEAIGLDSSLVEEYFTGTPSRIGGAGLPEIVRDMLRFYSSAYDHSERPQLEDAGYYRYRAGGEYHTFNPSVFRALHKAIRNGDENEYERYRNQVEARPASALRDLLEFRAGAAALLEDVEPASEIVRRFSTSGMSLGALSREAHETLAIAMNRIGARSNSGEGGEDPARWKPRENGDSANSRIKQVASGRFGVTPEYLVSADELEIKISQGSKPGEGGQLPGHKVTAEIAAIRHSVPGVTLISPPPHHDIYSIEDLAQLIYDLKQVNPSARVAVKLVSVAGVGTVAAGVAKAHADVIHISGHDGGTGASPLGSIKNAGSPWELGLAETQQVLVLNGLRGRVRLRADSGMKTGRDVVVAAMLGAEEFGFASSALVALGCVMARQCHLNTCPVGIATQAPSLRERFAGKPEMVVSYFFSVAEQVRRILAELGYRSLDEIVGRSDLLVEKRSAQSPRGISLDLGKLVARADPAGGSPLRFTGRHRHSVEVSLDNRILKDASRAIARAKPAALHYKIRNTDRSVGAGLAGEIARRRGKAGIRSGTIDISFEGSAGQSFGAFAVQGMRLTLIGDANDYVGKGMNGGEIIIRPPDEARFDWAENVIIGNTVMYGATGGTLFAAGRAGERFCVRNSGGTAVVEGVGDHGCEYMVGGAVVVLGDAGRNFAAGMTGGVAYVLDMSETFKRNCNHELVELEPVAADSDARELRQLIERHHEATGSRRAREVLWRWDVYRHLFWKVVTQGRKAAEKESKAQPVEQDIPVRHKLSASQ